MVKHVAAERCPYPEGRMRTSDQLALSAYWLATNLHWGAILVILIPSQMNQLAPRTRAQSIGLLEGVGAIAAMFVPLVVGALSDRCQSRWGRRRPYMAAGVAINLAGLVLMWLAAALPDYWLYLAGYLVVQVGNGAATGSYSGGIPDLAPLSQRGEASGYMAVMTQVGTMIGAVGGGILMRAGHAGASYAAIGVTLVVFVLISMAGMPEQRIETAPEPFHLKAFLGSLWISPRRYPDFAWVWITRFLMTMGIWTIEPFLQYYLGDVIGAQHPAETAGKLMGAILAGATVTGLIGGRISDRVGRKPVVYVANSIAAAAAIGLIFAHTLQSALIIGMVFGFGYGAYYSVDWALGCDVLPRQEDAAKDLGVWHVAMTLPQTLAAPVAGNLLAAFGQRMVMGPNGPVAHYLLPGYMAIFSLSALLLVLAAVLLRQVKGAR